jgi:hypothetical protein
MKRRGTSLMEVLIAIFVLALGLVSLLTLFPIGYVQMARAVQDERAAELAANAASYMRTLWKSACENSARITPGGQPLFTDAYSLNSFTGAMDDPNVYLTGQGLDQYETPPSNPNWPVVVTPTLSVPGLTPLPMNAAVAAGVQRLIAQANLTQSSYPVFVDPVGFQAAGSGASQLWVGYPPPPPPPNVTTYSIPRRQVPPKMMNGTPRYPASVSFPQTLRNCMLQDDMDFNTTSGPVLPDMQNRVAQYSCAWLLQRDNNNKRTEVNVTVVVYHRRSIETLSDEVACWATPGTAPISGGVQFSPKVTLHYPKTGPKPGVRRGGWILDATMYNLPNNSATVKHANYHRVTEVGDERPSATNTSEVDLDLQLETPMRPVPLNTLPNGFYKSRLIIIQDRVLEVFDKGPLEMNSPSRIN